MSIEKKPLNFLQSIVKNVGLLCNNNNNKTDVSDQKLSQFCQLTQDNQEVVNKIKDKNVVMLMGATGSGKSTTTNVLCGCKPVKEKIQNEHNYRETVYNTYPPDGFTPMKIGHSEVSETSIAGVAKDPTSPDVMYVDAMGHKDNRGWEVALANSANIMSIAKCCKTLKLMVLIPATSASTNRGESIVEMLNALEYFLQPAGGITAFTKSILVLVTKAETMEHVNKVKAIVHKVNNKLKVVGLSFDDKNRARYKEAKDETEFHAGTVEELKSVLKDEIEAVSLKNARLQAPITDNDRQVLHKLQEVLKNTVQEVGLDNIEKALEVYNAFYFLKAIQCPEVDSMLENMQNVFLAQFQQRTTTVIKNLEERNLQAALEIKNKLELALQSIQKLSPQLSQFISKQKVLETCDHLIKQLQKFEEELKVEKKAKENAVKQKQDTEQAKRNVEILLEHAYQQIKKAEERAEQQRQERLKEAEERAEQQGQERLKAEREQQQVQQQVQQLKEKLAAKWCSIM
eukprot:TRINITY_DN153_c0_g1_i3.p1 TRINITY_DN153_c0_g1~~TRINITY_DN153_c0_g1_i3.p1  ORF type:complete len:514 (-),score=71.04 TRINITY_DN153_c0_g1_i3:423-1964(-)